MNKNNNKNENIMNIINKVKIGILCMVIVSALQIVFMLFNINFKNPISYAGGCLAIGLYCLNQIRKIKNNENINSFK